GEVKNIIGVRIESWINRCIKVYSENSGVRYAAVKRKLTCGQYLSIRLNFQGIYHVNTAKTRLRRGKSGIQRPIRIETVNPIARGSQICIVIRPDNHFAIVLDRESEHLTLRMFA